jgi:arginase
MVSMHPCRSGTPSSPGRNVPTRQDETVFPWPFVLAAPTFCVAGDLDPAEKEYVGSAGVSLLGVGTSADQLGERIEGAGFQRAYVHLDLDVLEPRDFDEVIYPVPEGMRYERLLNILRTLTERTTIVGSSLLEFVPGENPQLEQLRRIAEALEC